MNIRELIKIIALPVMVGTSVPGLSRQKTPSGFGEFLVPNKVTAVKIGEAVLMPLFGEHQVESQRPYRAKLKGDRWIVTGSIPRRWVAEMITGRIFRIDISRRTGAISRVGYVSSNEY